MLLAKVGAEFKGNPQSKLFKKISKSRRSACEARKINSHLVTPVAQIPIMLVSLVGTPFIFRPWSKGSRLRFVYDLFRISFLTLTKE